MAESKITEVETWRPVVGYEGWYEVSSIGRVRRVRGGNNNTFAGKILRPGTCPKGYRYVWLHKHGVEKSQAVHRLVSDAFIGPCAKGFCRNHMNGDPSDNRPENLEIVTKSRDVIHSYRLLGRKHTPCRGSKSGTSKLNEAQAVQIRDLYASGRHTMKAIGKMFGVTKFPIQQIVHRRSWKHV